MATQLMRTQSVESSGSRPVKRPTHIKTCRGKAGGRRRPRRSGLCACVSGSGSQVCQAQSRRQSTKSVLRKGKATRRQHACLSYSSVRQGGDRDLSLIHISEPTRR
eukprot:1765832-Lingulodinium_polyedra.AAC.1